MGKLGSLQGKKLDPCLIPYARINSKQITDSNTKIKALQVLEEKWKNSFIIKVFLLKNYKKFQIILYLIKKFCIARKKHITDKQKTKGEKMQFISKRAKVRST